MAASTQAMASAESSPATSSMRARRRSRRVMRSTSRARSLAQQRVEGVDVAGIEPPGGAGQQGAQRGLAAGPEQPRRAGGAPQQVRPASQQPGAERGGAAEQRQRLQQVAVGGQRAGAVEVALQAGQRQVGVRGQAAAGQRLLGQRSTALAQPGQPVGALRRHRLGGRQARDGVGGEHRRHVTASSPGSTASRRRERLPSAGGRSSRAASAAAAEADAERGPPRRPGEGARCCSRWVQRVLASLSVMTPRLTASRRLSRSILMRRRLLEPPWLGDPATRIPATGKERAAPGPLRRSWSPRPPRRPAPRRPRARPCCLIFLWRLVRSMPSAWAAWVTFQSCSSSFFRM